MTEKLICENRRARFDYEILATYEAGLMLTGTEIKSIRQGKVNLGDAYVNVRAEEAYLMQAHIDAYDKGGYTNHEPLRSRKLLLHKKQIIEVQEKTNEKGLSIIPLKMYFKKGYVKVLLGVGRGRKAHDKRAVIKERETNRELQKVLKRAK